MAAARRSGFLAREVLSLALLTWTVVTLPATVISFIVEVFDLPQTPGGFIAYVYERTVGMLDHVPYASELSETMQQVIYAGMLTLSIAAVWVFKVQTGTESIMQRANDEASNIRVDGKPIKFIRSGDTIGIGGLAAAGVLVAILNAGSVGFALVGPVGWGLMAIGGAIAAFLASRSMQVTITEDGDDASEKLAQIQSRMQENIRRFKAGEKWKLWFAAFIVAAIVAIYFAFSPVSAMISNMIN